MQARTGYGPPNIATLDCIVHYMHYICVDPGTHLAGGVPRVDTHSESRGVPDPPPYWGFRDEHIK